MAGEGAVLGAAKTYYEILGVEPTAAAATFDDRPRDLAGPSREEVEAGYALLGDPEARARYDAQLFPDGPPAPPPPPRLHSRRVAPWVWWVLAAGVLVAAIALAVTWRARSAERRDPVGQILASERAFSATMTARARLPPTTSTASPTRAPSPTAAALVAGATPPPPPTATPDPSPTPVAAPAAVPTETPSSPTPTPEPPPPPPAPPAPAPPPPPRFPATDRVGTQPPVNLRAGPGTGYPSLGGLPPGTLLAATGEATTVNGALWRRFRVADGRVGWVRDLDTFPVR